MENDRQRCQKVSFQYHMAFWRYGGKILREGDPPILIGLVMCSGRELGLLSILKHESFYVFFPQN